MKEFGGIGRTWLVAVGLLVSTVAFVFMGHMTMEQWIGYSKVIFGIGGAKSIALGVAERVRRLPGEKV